MMTVPAEFSATLEQRHGPAGAAWAATLPSVADDLCRRWHLTVDGPPMTGHLALVVPVTRDGEPCVLRLAAFDGSAIQEARALRLWAGRGTVLLLEDDPDLGAMLLERLDSNRSLATLPVIDAMRVAGELIRTLAVPGVSGFPTVAGHAATIRENVLGTWERLERPVPRRLVDTMLDLTVSLPTTDSRMVHWDLWDGNILAGTRLRWIAIDPRTAVGPPEFGVAQLLWRRIDEMSGPADLDRNLAVLIAAAGLDLELTRGWTVVRVVDYWLWALGIGLTEDPVRCATLLGWLGDTP